MEPIDLHQAIVESCDIYFYQLGLKVGVDRIAQYANEFGLGKKTGIPLPHERPGIVPFIVLEEEAFGRSLVQRRNPLSGRGPGISHRNPPSARRCSCRLWPMAGRLYLPQVVEKVTTFTGTTSERVSSR